MKLPFANLEVALVDDWKKLKTYGTVIFGAVMGFIQLFGPELRDWWISMPDDVKAIIPANYQVAIKYAIAFFSIIALRAFTVRKIGADDDAAK